jgi:Flp pilus assembly protein CpaB
VRSKIPLLLAIVLAGMAVALIVKFLDQQKVTKEYETIVVAALDIPQGDLIVRQSLKTQRIEKQAFIGSMLRSGEENNYINYLAVTTIRQGEPVFRGALRLRQGIRQKFAPKITVGMRGVSFPVDKIGSVAQLVEPGDRVDILIHLKLNVPVENTANIPQVGMMPITTDKQEPMTVYLLQDVKVLACGKTQETASASESEEQLVVGYDSVTIEATPEEAAVVAFAIWSVGQGSATPFTLLLRNPSDEQVLEKVNVTNFNTVIDTANLENLFKRARNTRVTIYKRGENVTAGR